MISIGSVATAQPTLVLKRVTVNWPAVELYYQVGCNGLPKYDLNKSDFRVLEDGVEVPTLTQW